jgi:hypothetical protein
MYYRTLGAACAMILTSLSLAQAAAPQIVISDDGSQNVRAKLNDAAQKLCADARARDVFDDYGTQDECVTATISSITRRNRGDIGSRDRQTIAAVK